MRKAAHTAHDAYDFDDDDSPAPLRKPRRALGGRQMRRILAGGALVVGAVIVVNALTLQDQRHAAPLFGKSTTIAVRGEPREQTRETVQEPAPLPAPRPATVAQRTTDATTTQAIAPTADAIGREIARIELRGAPAKAESAKAEPAKPAAPRTAERLAQEKPRPAHADPKPEQKKAEPKKAEAKAARPDAIASLLKPEEKAGPDRNVLAAQRALQKLGYVVSPNGMLNVGTRQAVAQFERDHQIKGTGDLSPKTMRELARLSGVTAQ